MPPQLSVVVVNWNTQALLKNCLNSILADSVAGGWQVIVVDNASTDDSAAMIAREFPAVQLIRNAENVGFARANNQGLRASTGPYVLFLNSDTRVPTGALPKLVEFMDDHSEAGACSPRLARADGSAQPFAFGGDPTPAYLFARGWMRLIRHRAVHDWETRESQSVDWVSGACLLARRDAMLQVGGFDESFFMYFEDNDLCLRLRRAGWKIFYNSRVSITHLGGASLAQTPTRRRYYDASLRRFYSKHYSLPARIALEIMLPFYRRMDAMKSR